MFMTGTGLYISIAREMRFNICTQKFYEHDPIVDNTQFCSKLVGAGLYV